MFQLIDDGDSYIVDCQNFVFGKEENFTKRFNKKTNKQEDLIAKYCNSYIYGKGEYVNEKI